MTKIFAFLFSTISMVALGQTQIGYTAKYSAYTDLKSTSYNSDRFNYLEGFIQTRLSSRWDTKLSFGFINKGFTRGYINLSTPYYLTHAPDEQNRSRGLFVEPILSYGMIWNESYGGGIGVGYQQNWKFVSFKAGARSIYESFFFENFANDYSSWVNEFYLGVGFWLPRSNKKVYSDEIESQRRHRLWITGTAGTDDEYFIWGGSIMGAFKGTEWLGIGAEFTRFYTTQSYLGDPSSPSPPVITTIPLNAFTLRGEIRPVQMFNPISKWDPYFAINYGKAYDVEDQDWFFESIWGAQLGMRYWATDHIGFHVEGGVGLKLGMFAGVSYRI